jgi:hypothetical protein
VDDVATVADESELDSFGGDLIASTSCWRSLLDLRRLRPVSVSTGADIGSQMRVFKVRSRLLRPKVPGSPNEAKIEIRKRELAATVQKALKVGASLEAREAGRKAFSEFMKFVTDPTHTEESPKSVVNQARVVRKMPFSRLRSTLRRLRKDEPKLLEQEDKTEPQNSR